VRTRNGSIDHDCVWAPETIELPKQHGAWRADQRRIIESHENDLAELTVLATRRSHALKQSNGPLDSRYTADAIELII